MISRTSRAVDLYLELMAEYLAEGSLSTITQSRRPNTGNVVGK
jgi:hypothetical protein